MKNDSAVAKVYDDHYATQLVSILFKLSMGMTETIN